MISKAQIGFIKSLDQKKYRNQYKVFFVEGIKLVNELLISEYKLHSLFTIKEWVEQHPAFADQQQDKIHIITEKELNQISSLTTPNQVLAIFSIPDQEEPDISNSDIVLCLEAIRDPGNLGTIIRIGDWYGITHILCSDDCVDLYNPKVVQASMGSISRVKVDYVDLKKYLKNSAGFSTYATSLSGENIHSMNLKFPALVVIGNESNGISKYVFEACRYNISIPRYGGAESLNAAMATAILLDKFKLNSLK
jgi:RNA methyltransferase, TrmH family